MQTDCCTPQSVTSAAIKSAVACGAACGDAGTHNVCAHRMSQDEGFVTITIHLGVKQAKDSIDLRFNFMQSGTPGVCVCYVDFGV